MKTIDSFSGPYAFLSNFCMHPVHLDGRLYPSVEHAYQAAKALDPKLRVRFQLPIQGAHAKRLGRKVRLRADWENVKNRVMLTLLREKFSDESFGKNLLATGDARLVEGNTWGDTYWGVCRGEGQNMLGFLLMQVRYELTIGLGRYDL
jgi:ribA/ribD-fused uncharacterized protein